MQFKKLVPWGCGLSTISSSHSSQSKLFNPSDGSRVEDGIQQT